MKKAISEWTLLDAQRAVEELQQPPNRITMVFGDGPIGTCWSDRRVWHAGASWGPGDTKHVCYGEGWEQALIALAISLEIKYGYRVESDD